MIILGLNIYHGDASACIFRNGELKAAVEEERFTRIKHSAGFPVNAIRFCLDSLSIDINEIDFIAINRNPKSRFFYKFLYLIKNRLKINNFLKRVENYNKIYNLSEVISDHFSCDANSLKKKLLFFDHHLCHAASSVFPSGSQNTDYATIDGFGDFLSTTIGEYKNNQFILLDEVKFPHSLGIFYTAVTQFLGFENYGDEYKVMGLASYGSPIYFDHLLKIITVDNKNLFRLNLDYFKHHTSDIETSWLERNPNFATVFTNSFCTLFGNSRKKNDELLQKHKDIASSAQAVYEFILFYILNNLQKKTRNMNLCLSGGCAMNSVANGKILKNTNYKNIFINFAPSDSGGAIGAALLALKKFNQKVNIESLNNPYLGNNYSNFEIKKILETYKKSKKLFNEKITINFFEDLNKKKLFKFIAREISNKKIIGFFNGKMEFGARALGGRSIIADPRDPDIKKILNLKIKRRESFRPFAPSILCEHMNEWFDIHDEVPFMSKVYKVREDKKKLIPAVVHIDGTGRLQTVDGKYNKDYHCLISEFYNLTKIPIVLNTSFNENEPIVCNPEQAIDCFLRTKMDHLVLENFVLSRNL